jgi:hypothetical protein
MLTAAEGRNVLDRIDSPRLVLVEGSDDQAIIAALIRQESLDGFHVHNMVGKDKWSGRLLAICRVAGFGKVLGLGLVRDADDDAQGTLASCKTTLARARLPVPDMAGQLAEGRPSVAVAIVPTSDGIGAIEEVCLPSFDEGRMACVDNYFACLATTGQIRTKARVQVYLAGESPQCRDLKVAANSGVLNLAHGTFDGLREFLHELRSA